MSKWMWALAGYRWVPQEREPGEDDEILHKALDGNYGDDKVNCKLHVSVPMTAIRQRVPFQSIDGPQESSRTVYRCSVPGCPVVAFDYDESRVDSRYCNVCGERIEGRENITDRRCQKCLNAKRRSRDIPLTELLHATA